MWNEGDTHFCSHRAPHADGPLKYGVRDEGDARLCGHKGHLCMWAGAPQLQCWGRPACSAQGLWTQCPEQTRLLGFTRVGPGLRRPLDLSFKASQPSCGQWALASTGGAGASLLPGSPAARADHRYAVFCQVTLEQALANFMHKKQKTKKCPSA